MLCYPTFEKTVMLMMVTILAVGSTASPTHLDGEASLTIDDARSFSLKSETDRALSVADVNMNVGKLLSKIKSSTDVNTAQTQITTYLQGAYGNQTNWLVYVAQNFNPPSANVSINNLGKSTLTGNVIVGIWTVYWAAAPVAPADSKPLILDKGVITSKLSNCSSTNDGPLTASMVFTCLSNAPLSSGRNPNAMFIFLSSNPGPKFSVGQSPGVTNKQSLIIITITTTTTTVLQSGDTIIIITRTRTTTIIIGP